MKAIDLIAKAKTSILLNNPFYANIIMRVPFIENKECPTLQTDSTKIEYNPLLIEASSVQEIRFYCYHEAFHIIFLHHLRRGIKNPDLYNKAADYVINSILKEMADNYNNKKYAISVPDWVSYDVRFKGMYVEEVYKILLDENPQQNKPQQGNNQQGSGQSSGNSKGDSGGESPYEKAKRTGRFDEVKDLKNKEGKAASESEKKENEQQWKGIIQQSHAAAKRAGKVPLGIDRIIEELFEPQIDWRSVLSQYLTTKVYNDYTWLKRNLNYVFADIYMPKLESEQVGNILIWMDTSGSVGKKEMEILATEVQGILSSFNVELSVGYFDSNAYEPETIEANDYPLKLHPKGGGGTDFDAPVRYVIDNYLEPECVIILTDGYCSSFYKEEPSFPVLWVVYGKKEFNPPYGEVMFIKEF